MPERLRVIFFQECDLWSAQCLEYDIGAQAADLDTLKLRMNIVLDMEFAESLEKFGEPFAGIGPAPERFDILWERRARSFDADDSIEFRSLGRSMHVNVGLAA